MDTKNLIFIGNKGQAISYTNFFDSENASMGFFYLSWNAGAGRLLVPDSQKRTVIEMLSAKYVIVSSGPWVEQGSVSAHELLFEDNSDAPFVIIIPSSQCDRILPKTDKRTGFYISVWTRGGQKLRLPCRQRWVASLPCMDAWGSQ